MNKIFTIKYNSGDKNRTSYLSSFFENLKNKNSAIVVYANFENIQILRAELFFRKLNITEKFTPLIVLVNMSQYFSNTKTDTVLNLCIEFSKLDNVFVFNFIEMTKGKIKGKHDFEDSLFLEKKSIKTIKIEELKKIKLNIKNKPYEKDPFFTFNSLVLRRELPLLNIHDLIFLVQENIISKRNDFGLLTMISSVEKEDVLIDLKEKQYIIDCIGAYRE